MKRLMPLINLSLPKDLDEEKTIEYALTSTVLLSALCVTALYIPFYLILAHPVSRYGIAMTGFTLVFFAMGLLALKKLNIRWAINITSLVGQVAITCSTFLIGKDMGFHFYMMVVTGITLLGYPKGFRYHAYAIEIISILLFLITLIFAGDSPFIGPPLPSQLTMIVKINVLITVFILNLLYLRWSQHLIKKAYDSLTDERNRSERLLLNILPKPIADRLKINEGNIADGFNQVTVLFADIEGFTQLSESLSAKELVTMLNEIFSSFDKLSLLHQLEKIKTIGDAYMVAGGIPEPMTDHAAAVIHLAQDMLDFIETYRTPSGLKVNLRIGVNTGPVVAGVIGLRKFIYDLWGDTVNIAARMEQSCEGNRIQVTQATVDAAGEQFVFASRGQVAIKGKGMMETWVLEGRRPRDSATFYSKGA